MMRDSRGRFVNDREHAATALLEAALTEGRQVLAAALATDDPMTIALDRATVADDLADACKWADVLMRSE